MATTLIDVLYSISLPFITLGLICFIIYSFWRSKKLFAVATITSLVAFACITIILPLLVVEHGRQMLFHPATREIFYGWMIIVTYLIAEFKYRIRLLGSILMPIALLFLLLASFEDRTPIQSWDFEGIPTLIHMLLVFTSFALVLLAFAAASLYMLKMRALKQRQANALDEDIPALTTLKRMMRASFLLAFPLLSVGLILGAIYAGTTLTPGWYTHPFMIAVSMIWLGYAVLVYMLHAGRLSSLNLARSTLVLFALMVALSFFGSHESLLDKGATPTPAVEELP